MGSHDVTPCCAKEAVKLSTEIMAPQAAAAPPAEHKQQDEVAPTTSAAAPPKPAAAAEALVEASVAAVAGVPTTTTTEQLARVRFSANAEEGKEKLKALFAKHNQKCVYIFFFVFSSSDFVFIFFG